MSGGTSLNWIGQWVAVALASAIGVIVEVALDSTTGVTVDVGEFNGGPLVDVACEVGDPVGATDVLVRVAVGWGVLVCIAVGTTVVASGMIVLVGGNGVLVLVLVGGTTGVGVAVSSPAQPLTVTLVLVRGVSMLLATSTARASSV